MENVNDLSLENTDIVEETRKRPAWQIWVAASIIGITIGYFGAMAAQKIQNAANDPNAEYVQEFELELLTSDGTLKLSDYKGKAIVLNFWASWCLPCKIEMPALQQAWEDYQDQDIVFIGVNMWDEEQSALDFLAEFGVTYPNGYDPLELIEDNYYLTGVPTTWFIYPDGSVAHKVMGPLDLDSLDAAIALILGEEG